MSEYTANVAWTRAEGAIGLQYSRRHMWAFDGGLEVPASASPLHVRSPWSDPACVDPEEAFVAAIASCHMLFFLAIAAEDGHDVQSYVDQSVGIMSNELGEEGGIWMSSVVLRPRVAFVGHAPDLLQLQDLHARAHHACYLARSVRTHIVIQPTVDQT